VHPLDYPKVPQVDKIPSEYFLNLQLESPFQLLEHDADWIELKKEAFISEQDMKKIKLNDLNSYEDDFGIPEGFKTSKTSSVLQPNLVLNPSDKSSDPELDHNFALTNLIENSLKHIPTTQINNPIDPNLIDSSHQDELLEGIQTYPAHPKAFFHDSSVNQTENSRTTAGKPKDKHPTETLSYNEVLTSYPVYSGITSSTPSVYYNIFESDALESFSSITPTMCQMMRTSLLISLREVFLGLHICLGNEDFLTRTTLLKNFSADTFRSSYHYRRGKGGYWEIGGSAPRCRPQHAYLPRQRNLVTLNTNLQ
jgi:hypothetical protein